jgi:DNA-binding MarR family transcriptional regulator
MATQVFQVFQVLKTQWWVGESAEAVAAKAAQGLGMDASVVLSSTRKLEDAELEERYFPLEDERVTFAEALPWIEPSEMPRVFALRYTND